MTAEKILLTEIRDELRTMNKLLYVIATEAGEEPFDPDFDMLESAKDDLTKRLEANP